MISAASRSTPAELLAGIDAEALSDDERPYTVEDFHAAKKAAKSK